MLQNGAAAFMSPDPVAYPAVLPIKLLSLDTISLSTGSTPTIDSAAPRSYGPPIVAGRSVG